MHASLDRYRVFYQAALQKSVTLAAKSLFISQPAASRTIRALEEELGCPLFARTAKGVALTPEGETLFHYVEAGLDQFAIGEKKLAAQRSLESGEIRVGASDMTLQFFLLPFLEDFHRRYPGVKVSVTNGPTPETIRILKEERIDFGIISEPADTAGLSLRPVGQIRDIFIAGGEFARLAGRPLPLKAFETLPVICLEKGTSSTRRYIDDFFAAAGVQLAPEFELATSSLIVQFARRNLGVGCVVEDFAREALEEGAVTSLTLEQEPPPRSISVVQGSGPISKAAQRLLELIFS